MRLFEINIKEDVNSDVGGDFSLSKLLSMVSDENFSVSSVMSDLTALDSIDSRALDFIKSNQDEIRHLFSIATRSE